MKMTRMYTGEDGVSHFEDVEIALKETDVGDMSRRLFPQHTFFRTTPEGLLVDWHTSPGKRMIVILQGVVQVEVGGDGGEVRRFGPGEIVLAEDATGPGHKTLDVEGPRFSMMVDLPDDFDIQRWARPRED